MRSLLKTLYIVTGLLYLGLSQADTLTMPEPEPEATQQDSSVQVPGRGMTMTAVEEKFGSPDTKYDEVGDPPITRWDYPQFSVYFEYQYVIHSVVKANP